MSEKSGMIAYCGLYCQECASYTGKIADLARDLRKELRTFRYDKIAESLSSYSFFEVFKHYPECYQVLGGLVKMRCKRGCKAGGGPPFCKIRKCCVKKGIEGCWECDDFKTCTKLDFLRPSHGDAHLKNLRILSRHGVDHFLEGKKHWYVKPKE
jgi:hypothetical protein